MHRQVLKSDLLIALAIVMLCNKEVVVSVRSNGMGNVSMFDLSIQFDHLSLLCHLRALILVEEYASHPHLQGY